MQFRSSLFTKKLITFSKEKHVHAPVTSLSPIGWKDEDRPDGVLRFMGNPSPNPHDDEKLDGEHGRESDDGGERDQPAVDLPALASLIAELSKWIAGRSMAGGARCKSGHRQCRRLHHRRCANAGFRKRT